MKKINISIKTHSPVRRRPSIHQIVWVVSDDFPNGAYLPLQPYLHPTIVHTGTTKGTLKNLAEMRITENNLETMPPNSIESLYECNPDEAHTWKSTKTKEQVAWEILGKKLKPIEVHKRPNILKRIKNWRKRWMN